MRAKLVFPDSSQRADIRSAIKAALTGETVVANLPAGVDKPNSYIDTSINAAGWVVHDDDSSFDSGISFVLRAPYVDNATSYKYVRIHYNTSNIFNIQGYEDWDNVAHTGVNQTDNSVTAYPQGFDTSTGETTLYIWSSERFMAFWAQSTSFTGDKTYKSPTIAAEISRLAPWNTSVNGAPSFVIIHVGSCIYGQDWCHVPRAIASDGTTKTGSDCGLYLVTIGTAFNYWSNINHFPINADHRIPDGLGNSYVPMLPLYCHKFALYGMPLGNITEVSDIWIPPGLTMNHLEETTRASNSRKYEACQAFNNATYGHTILFPKG